MFDAIKKSLKTSVVKSSVVSGCLTNIVPWNVPNQKTHMVLNGDSVARVYIYDASPLGVADPFILNVAFCDGVLHSKYTGTTFDTKEDRGVIVMYGNVPVGSISIKREKVEHFARQGIGIQVTAYSDGWIQFGCESIRNVKAKVPADWIA